MAQNNGAAAKRRRSLYVEEPLPSGTSSSSEDQTSLSTETKGETDYVRKLKDCKKSWIKYQKDLKSRLSNPPDPRRKITDVQKNWKDYLDVEDQQFLENTSKFSSSLDAASQKMKNITNDVELIKASIDANRKSFNKLHENLLRASKLAKKQEMEKEENLPYVIRDHDWVSYQISDDAPRLFSSPQR